jgi:hypothetical protein
MGKDNKKKKDNDESFDYEKLLNDLSGEKPSQDEVTSDYNLDLDEVALSEILGDEVGEESTESGVYEVKINEEVSEATRSFDEVDLSDITEEVQEETSEKESVPPPEEENIAIKKLRGQEIVLDDGSGDGGVGYASFLGEMMGSEASDKIEEIPEAGSKVFHEVIDETLDFSTTMGVISGEGTDEQPGEEILTEENSETVTQEYKAYTEPEEVSGGDEYSVAAEETLLSESGQTGGDTVETPAYTEEEEQFSFSGDMTGEQVADVSVTGGEEEKEEDDFLGLGGLKPKVEKRQEEEQVEVLFPGIEMDFNKQIDIVTRAEILLAQGKKKEAAELFAQILAGKGVTSWVGKRLNQLGLKTE